MKSVARPPDVAVTASANPQFVHPVLGAATGRWTAGEPELVLHPRARSDGSPLVRSASCTFTYKGEQNAEPHGQVRSTSTVTLTARPHRLTVGGGHVLVDGDQATDANGNHVTVTSTATWHTT